MPTKPGRPERDRGNSLDDGFEGEYLQLTTSAFNGSVARKAALNAKPVAAATTEKEVSHLSSILQISGLAWPLRPAIAGWSR